MRKLNSTLLQTERIFHTEEGKEVKIPGLFAYWFVAGDSMAPTHFERMIKMVTDRLFNLKSHRWAYVFAQTTSADGNEAGLERLEEVIQLALPKFQTVGFEDEADPGG